MTIRPATVDDAAAIQAIYAPVVTETAISFEVDPPPVEEIRQRIASTLARLPWLVAEDATGKLLGYVYASRHRERAAYQWSVETSVYVHADARGQGVGSALYRVLLEQLGEQGYVQALAGITIPNPASVALHERLGFVALGTYRGVGFKQGAWHDVGWWQRPLSSPGVPPEAPRAPALVGADPLPDPSLWHAFQHQHLPATAWTHQAHLRMAWLHLRQHPLEEAHLLMRVGIIRLNASHGLVETPMRGYHETITRAFLVLVATRMRARPDLLDSLSFVEAEAIRSDTLLRYYRPERLKSPAARSVFVAPDLEPLPE